MPTGGAATGVELLYVLFPTSLQIGQSGTNVVSGCAEANQLINWHNLGHGGKTANRF